MFTTENVAQPIKFVSAPLLHPDCELMFKKCCEVFTTEQGPISESGSRVGGLVIGARGWLQVSWDLLPSPSSPGRLGHISRRVQKCLTWAHQTADTRQWVRRDPTFSAEYPWEKTCDDSPGGRPFGRWGQEVKQESANLEPLTVGRL